MGDFAFTRMRRVCKPTSHDCGRHRESILKTHRLYGKPVGTFYFPRDGKSSYLASYCPKAIVMRWAMESRSMNIQYDVLLDPYHYADHCESALLPQEIQNLKRTQKNNVRNTRTKNRSSNRNSC